MSDLKHIPRSNRLAVTGVLVCCGLLTACGGGGGGGGGTTPPPTTAPEFSLTGLTVRGDLDAAGELTAAGQADQDSAATSFSVDLSPGADGLPPYPATATDSWTADIALAVNDTAGNASDEVLTVTVAPATE